MRKGRLLTHDARDIATSPKLAMFDFRSFAQLSDLGNAAGAAPSSVKPMDKDIGATLKLRRYEYHHLTLAPGVLRVEYGQSLFPESIEQNAAELTKRTDHA